MGHVLPNDSLAGEEMVHSWTRAERNSRGEGECAGNARTRGTGGHVAKRGWMGSGTRDPRGREMKSG